MPPLLQCEIQLSGMRRSGTHAVMNWLMNHFEGPIYLLNNLKVRQFDELEDNENAVVICQLIKQDRRDKNEAMLVNKRGGTMAGQTLFLDSFVVDDSVSKPVRVRTQPRDWFDWGETMADKGVPKVDWFLIRGRWLEEFSMFIAKKVKCLTNEEMFQ